MIQTEKLSISGKVIGYILATFGLLILAEPYFSTGLLADTFIGTAWTVNATGMGLLTLGAVLITGLPTANKMWEQIEYGIPILFFFAGISLLYINTWGTGEFVYNLSSYILFSTVAVIIVGAVKVIYTE